mmetsp:Transcript_1200/g.2619  ORF Transcript_1200/g.2619 Transcript_1200/m.2619 type:complete len:523 (-) Transcript_1200:65-1633(-)
MIHYKRGGIEGIRKLFQMRGSVFPWSMAIAFPPAVITFAAKYLVSKNEDLGEHFEYLEDASAWSSFSILVGFLIIFRTSQSYARFWDGATSTHGMRAEWLNACSAMIAFCKYSKAGQVVVVEFKHMIIRLFSMLHALALAEIEDSSSNDVEDVRAFRLQLIDADGMDQASLKAIKESDSKVELVIQWIQQYIIENIETGIVNIPAPILTRAFQEIAQGNVQFNEAVKISCIPFPFPYAQACDCLLILYAILLPLYMVQYVKQAAAACFLCFIQIFTLWTLNFIAVEIENPFGEDSNDLEPEAMQMEMNHHLLSLLHPAAQRTPRLAHHRVGFQGVDRESGGPSSAEKRSVFGRKSVGGNMAGVSFFNIWSSLEDTTPETSMTSNSTLRRTVSALSADGTQRSTHIARSVRSLSRQLWHGQEGSRSVGVQSLMLPTPSYAGAPLTTVYTDSEAGDTLDGGGLASWQASTSPRAPPALLFQTRMEPTGLKRSGSLESRATVESNLQVPPPRGSRGGDLQPTTSV